MEIRVIMNINKIIGFLFLVSLFFVGGSVYASTNIHLGISVGSNYIYNKDISVSPCDSNNDGIVDNITAYCALLQSGVNMDGSFSAYGYFINAINGLYGYADDSGDWHYWEFYTNGSYASSGVASYVLSGGDDILISFLNPSSFDVSKVLSSKSGGILIKDSYSKDKALKFIYSKQKENGSFGESLYTDWVAIGIAKESDLDEEVKDKLKNYLLKQDFKGFNITDYERHAMSLMAMGINPYNGTKVNYIKKIIKNFDGIQIGDKNLINDDVFGLIVLQNVGYSIDDKIINKLIRHIISNQNENGSWGGSVDMTSATIMSLYEFKDIENVKNSIKKGYKYIKKNEIIKANKNFGNPFSASWAMQAFSLEDWYQDEIERGLKFLARKQHNDDGYIKESSKDSILWATAYSVPASSGFSWNDILVDFQIIK